MLSKVIYGNLVAVPNIYYNGFRVISLPLYASCYSPFNSGVASHSKVTFVILLQEE
jgi:hypothetical protein